MLICVYLFILSYESEPTSHYEFTPFYAKQLTTSTASTTLAVHFSKYIIQVIFLYNHLVSDPFLSGGNRKQIRQGYCPDALRVHEKYTIP